MKSIKFIKYYYNGCIMPYAVSYHSTEYKIENNEIYVIIEREHYLSEEDEQETQLLKGKALLKDLIYVNADEFFKNLEFVKNCVENNYKEEYFIDKIPHCLSTSVIIIDGKEYKFANNDLKDMGFRRINIEINKNVNLINLPNKFLKEVLNKAPFKTVE